MNQITTTYSAKSIANRFILSSEKHGCFDLSPMKLQKLVYFAHGWYLAIKDHALIKDDIEAWNYGPVIPELYHSLKGFGSEHISETIKSYKFDYSNIFSYETVEEIAEGPDLDELIEAIWNVYGKYNAIQLSNLTHEHGSPWHTISQQFAGNIPPSVVIPTELTKQYFKSKLNGGAQ